MTVDGPYISRALFCEKIDETEGGVKSFINTIDTLNFRLDDPSVDLAATPIQWSGMLEVELMFGEFTGEIILEMNQREVATGETKRGLSQTFETSNFPGMHSISLALEFTVAYTAQGTYWYEFYLNGTKKTQIPLKIRILD